MKVKTRIAKEQHDAMTKQIVEFCGKTDCRRCPLEGRRNCYSRVTDYELLQNYIAIFGENVLIL